VHIFVEKKGLVGFDLPKERVTFMVLLKEQRDVRV